MFVIKDFSIQTLKIYLTIWLLNLLLKDKSIQLGEGLFLLAT